MYRYAEMTALGYRLGAPSQEAEEIDTEIAERYQCPKCGGLMRYEGYYKRNGGHCSYIALAVCARCGHQIEF